MVAKLRTLCWIAAVTAGCVFGTSPARAELIVRPQSVLLDSPESSSQLLVSQPLPEGRQVDVGRQVSYSVLNPAIARVEEGGLVRPLQEGQTQIVIKYKTEEVRVPLQVTKLLQPDKVSFQNEVVQVLTKSRCNSGGCHGKAEGQGGFKLSIFGFDTTADFTAIAKESRGRRLFPGDASLSLLLQKGTATVPHGGGRKLDQASYRYRRLARWISEGAELDDAEGAGQRIVSVEVEPQQQVLLAGESQQLRVLAVDERGEKRCVTAEAEYESNAVSIADVNPTGLVQASQIPGEAAILVRYLGHVAVCRITQPRPNVTFRRPPENNFIDKLVWNKLERLGILPSDLADDATFLRRVYLDVLGVLPTSAEARAFLADKSPDKRSKLIDRLLDRPEYADFWTMRWLNLLRADQLEITPQGTVAMQRWLRRHFQENRPYDQLAYELLTAQGSTVEEGPAAFYKVLKKPDEQSRAISQLLLGVRIECAQCHHHPSERWSQTDYTGLAGFFTGIKLKKLPGGGEGVVSVGGADLPHPRTKELVPTRALGAPVADFTSVTDRRAALAPWVVSRDNPYFAKAFVNRMWLHYFGRGLVDPVDDLRETNPASNEPLLQALADHLHDQKFNIKAFTRTLLNSRVYQLDSVTNDSNRDDVQNFSHALYKSLPAEVLLDAISQSTGVDEKFNGWPAGYRAVQVWDNRMPSYFLRIFGRPVRATVCECERSNEPSIAQALHLLNSPEIMAKIQDRHGTARRLSNTLQSPAEIIDELYLTTLSRLPTADEKTLMLEAFSGAGGSLRAGTEDVLWALLNSKSFIFNH